MRTNVYIDGFNFYYGAVKGTRYRWLNFDALARLLLPGDEIGSIHYFTARVHPTRANPDVHTRQNFFLRALDTVPTIQTQFGSFLATGGRFSEKGSDVNLATQMLVDCFDDQCDQLLLVSGDSDLIRPLELAKNRFGKKVIAAFTLGRNSTEVRRVVDDVMRVREQNLRDAQFPDQLTDAQGTFTKPPQWVGGSRYTEEYKDFRKRMRQRKRGSN